MWVYLNPPRNAVVLCIDEKEPDSGPGSYLGSLGTWYVDSRLRALRNGTTTLFRRLVAPLDAPAAVAPC